MNFKKSVIALYTIPKCFIVYISSKFDLVPFLESEYYIPSFFKSIERLDQWKLISSGSDLCCIVIFNIFNYDYKLPIPKMHNLAKILICNYCFIYFAFSLWNNLLCLTNVIQEYVELFAYGMVQLQFGLLVLFSIHWIRHLLFSCLQLNAASYRHTCLWLKILKWYIHCVSWLLPYIFNTTQVCLMDKPKLIFLVVLCNIHIAMYSCLFFLMWTNKWYIPLLNENKKFVHCV